MLVRENALLPALLALPQAADVQGRVLVVHFESRRSVIAWVELSRRSWAPAHIKDSIFGKWLEGARD